MKAEIYTDGGARPTNPGHAGFGVLVRFEDGREEEIGRYIGWHTNNRAEYSALIVGLKIAKEGGARDIVITLDSMLVMNQVIGEWRCKSAKLKSYQLEAQDRISSFDSVEWVHVRGHQGHVENERVDQLCTAAIKKGQAERKKINPFLKKLGR